MDFSAESITTRDRWLAAVSYLSILVFVPLLQRDRGDYVSGHTRQGFALLVAEVVALLVLLVIDTTIGRIPILGLLISIVFHLVVYLGILLVSILGFVRAAGGEEFRIPLLDEIADRLPI